MRVGLSGRAGSRTDGAGNADREADGAEGRPEERVQRERIVGGEEKTGGRMPR